MEEIIKTMLVYAAAAGVIYAAFDRLESLAGDQIRERVLLFLKGQLQDQPSQQFSSLFDRLFGHRHFSWRCFLISGVVSLIAVFAAYIGLNLWEIGARPPGTAFYYILVGALLANLVPDYLSLLESRVIIRWLPRFRVLGKGFLLLLDLIITFVIYTSFLLTYVYLGEGYSETSFGSFLDSLFGGSEVPRIVVATFLSTFSTSLWIYFYMFGVGATKMTRKWYLGVNLLEILKWQIQPVRAVGSIAAIYLFGLLCVIRTAFWLFN